MKIIKAFEAYDMIENANLICVDIQPEYEDYFSFDFGKFISYLNKNIDKLNSLLFFLLEILFS